MPTDRPDRADGPPGSDGAERSWRDAWPFLVALLVVVIAGSGIGISYLLRPADDRMSETAKVQHAINDSYTARNEVDYAKYRATTCAADVDGPQFPTEEVFRSDNERSREANGHIVIPEIADIAVTGDRGSAQVHWHFDDRPDDKQTTRVVVVRENDDWKVCTS